VLLEVETNADLGAGWVEGLFRINEISAHLALQSGLPEATIRARIIQALGYCKRPPKGGEKIICMDGRLYSVDDNAIRVMKRVIFDHVTSAEMEAIIEAYMADDFGDPYNISGVFFEGQIHPYIVIAVLDSLQEKGRLPLHPSRY
jgi:hypothetical protein